jgi:murein L,D-transpeptidase YafK
MILPLAAAATLSAGPRDTTSILSKRVTPTISRAPVTGIKSSIIADSIVVEKGHRTLTLFSAGIPIRTYQVALGKQPTGDKVQRGDNRTPEGTYFIDFKNPNSKYHKALHISYPDAAHAARANALGVSPGGDIMIHGLPPRFASVGAQHREFDWTEGCIAVTDKEIEEIWSAIPTGALIHIKP